jgi:nitroimidazol reductase NimA-like FMN-containing flavoprotein (pyridoxamine 5'-phosphate oxidase superfamily)
MQKQKAMKYHLRRKDRQINDKTELKRILKTTKYVTVALSMNNQPYLVSLSHGYDEIRNCLYFHCAKVGKKIDYIKSNNSVWGQALMDRGYAEGKCDHLFASIHFQGKITFVKDTKEKQKAIECMIRQLDKNPKAIIARLKPERLKAVNIGRIDIEEMTGKKHETKT